MSKFLITTTVGQKWNYVVEAETVEEARLRADIDFKESVADLEPIIQIVQKDDDTPQGDV